MPKVILNKWLVARVRAKFKASKLLTYFYKAYFDLDAAHGTSLEYLRDELLYFASKF